MSRLRLPVIVFAGLTALIGGTAEGAAPSLLDRSVHVATQGQAVAARFSYQGRLTDGGGQPLTGAHDLRFQFWDDAVAGSQVGGDVTVPGTPLLDGVFSVELDAPAGAVDGRALWLRIGVDGQWMAPRQAVLAVPYALSLRPGARIASDAATPLLTAANEGAGSGVAGESRGGHGVHGTSQMDFGVFGETSGGFAAGVGGQGPTGVFGRGAVVGVSGFSETGDAGVIGIAAAAGAKGVNGIASGLGGTGVVGTADLGTGMHGTGEVGVRADGSVGPGLIAQGSIGLSANGTNGDGVFASSAGTAPSAAVHGIGTGEAYGGRFSSSGGVGLWVSGAEGIHAEDSSGTAHAVHGVATTSDAIKGESTDGAGVVGQSTTFNAVIAAGGGSGPERAALRSISTHTASGMAAYFTNNSTYGNTHLNNSGSGEVLVLQGNGGRFLRAVDQSWDAKFRLEGNGQAYADGAWNAGGADFAELLPAADGLAPGDVLAIGADGRLVRTTSAYEAAVAGVYSTAPGFVGGQDADEGAPAGTVPLAVVGVVPVKASAENGPIRPGDLLVSAATAGHAMRAGPDAPQGTVIGKALGSLARGTGTVRMLASLQ